MKDYRVKRINFFVIAIYIFFMNACSTTGDKPDAELAATNYQQNIHYKLINPAVKVQAKQNKIEVVEMFFYACPHCYALESKILPWLEDKGNIVDFKRIPAILGPSWADQAKAYYVAEQLGILERIHPALLRAIHEDNRKFNDEYSVMKFFVEQNVDRQDFIEAYNSPEVAEKVNYARIMTIKYGIRGVPAIVINGKYKTAPFYFSHKENILAISDYLIAKEKSLLANNEISHDQD